MSGRQLPYELNVPAHCDRSGVTTSDSGHYIFCIRVLEHANGANRMKTSVVARSEVRHVGGIYMHPCCARGQAGQEAQSWKITVKRAEDRFMRRKIQLSAMEQREMSGYTTATHAVRKALA